MFERLRKWFVQPAADVVARIVQRRGDCGHSIEEIGETSKYCGTCRKRGFERSLKHFGEWRRGRVD